jgi:DNA-directed RNA polymerase subunit RPC12/RpoP
MKPEALLEMATTTIRPEDYRCWICGAPANAVDGRRYAACRRCGHELVLERGDARFVVNDVLDPEALRRPGVLDRFKVGVLRRLGCGPELLLDVGSASGRFLHAARRRFRRVLGVEINPECAEFSRSVLGLEVVNDISAVDAPFSAATFWHTLEHIPPDAAERILGVLRQLASPGAKVVVCVPNAASVQRRLFGTRYAYYDHPQHVHQFSPRSLDLLMERHGFRRLRRFFSLAYVCFGYLQGLLNFCNRRHNYWYYRRKRGWSFGLPRYQLALLDLYNAVLIVLLALPALILSLVDALVPARCGVLTAAYECERRGSA